MKIKYERRIQIVAVSPEALIALMTAESEHHFKVVEHGLPKDARVVAFGVDRERRAFLLQIESKEYPVTVTDEFPAALLPFTESPVFRSMEYKQAPTRL